MEYLTKLKTAGVAAVFLLSLGCMASCSSGTEPGDVNVEHSSSKHKNPAHLQDKDKKDREKMRRDSLEDEHYDQTEHEKHTENER